MEAMQKMQQAAEMPAMVLMPKAALDKITNSLEEVKDLILGKARQEVQAEWIESEEARKLLGVSLKTWQTYRDAKAIPFSQFGRKIYVKRADLDAFLESHKVGRN